jgi:hypothetical protein
MGMFKELQEKNPNALLLINISVQAKEKSLKNGTANLRKIDETFSDTKREHSFFCVIVIPA